MQKLFHFLKNRKTLFFVVLVCIIAGIAVPVVTHGQLVPIAAVASWLGYKIFGGGTSILDFKSLSNGLGSAFLNSIILGFYSMMAGVWIAFSIIAKVLLNAVIDFATAQSYTKSVAVNIGWPIVRDLANMMIVLGFVIIGIATALRIREYEAKQLLSKLIIVALLVNFSLLICGIFIDGSNILMNSFLKKSGSLTDSIPVLGDTWELIKNLGQNPATFTIKLLGLIFFNMIGGVSYLLYALLILFRVLALWMLVILSPLAFVCYVFPATKSIWQMWWNNFFQWCLVMVVGGLFYYIGAKLTTTISSSEIDLVKVDWQQYISDGVSVILIPGLFLIVGFFVSLSFAPAGAKAIMGFAQKQVTKGIKATGGAAKELFNRTEMAQKWARSRARFAASTGFAGADHGEAVEAKQKSEAKTRLENLRTSSDLGSRQAYENAVRHGTGIKGAAAVALANEKGELGKIVGPDINTQRGRVALATSHGFQESDFFKSNPNLADPNKTKEAVKNVSPTKASDWHHSVMTPEVAAAITPNQAKEIGIKGTPELVDKLKAIKYTSYGPGPKGKFGKKPIQSKEYLAAKKAVQASGPVGSVKRTRAENSFVALQKHLAKDANFA